MASNQGEDMFINCEVCDLAFTNIKSYEQHLKGKKHKKQVEEQKREIQVKSVDDDSCFEKTKDSDAQDYSCVLCKTEFTGIIPYTQHLKSKHHAKVIRRKKAEDDSVLFENDDSDSEFLDDDDANLNEMAKKILPEPYGSCVLCEKQFSGPEAYKQHMKSKSHKKQKSELQLLKKIKAILNICEISDSEEICEDKKEEKGLEAAEKLKCKVCDKVFSSSVSFAQHSISKSHKKREIQKKLLEDLEDINMMQIEDDSSSSEDEESSETLTCEICKLAFSGPENLKAHINSKKHQKVLKLKKFLAKKERSLEEDSRAETNLENKADTKEPSAE